MDGRVGCVPKGKNAKAQSENKVRGSQKITEKLQKIDEKMCQITRKKELAAQVGIT